MKGTAVPSLSANIAFFFKCLQCLGHGSMADIKVCSCRSEAGGHTAPCDFLFQVIKKFLLFCCKRWSHSLLTCSYYLSLLFTSPVCFCQCYKFRHQCQCKCKCYVKVNSEQMGMLNLIWLNHYNFVSSCRGWLFAILWSKIDFFVVDNKIFMGYVKLQIGYRSAS